MQGRAAQEAFSHQGCSVYTATWGHTGRAAGFLPSWLLEDSVTVGVTGDRKATASTSGPIQKATG